MPLLPTLRLPQDIKSLAPEQLGLLANELREYVLQHVHDKAGHIKSSFGVAELSVALHYLLNTPEDVLIWDVGHQAYIHKALTGRLNQLPTIRQELGISGFPSREESPYDAFGTGHSSTALSALGGFAAADQLSGRTRKRVAVVGDGALTGGMAYEALNHLGELRADVLLVFNDNCASIDENVGALHQRQSYEDFFRSLGWQYTGPADGHQLPELLLPLQEALEQSGPRVLHVRTQKGRGYAPVLGSGEKANPAFQETLGQALDELAEKNPKLVVVSPAMISGAGLSGFQKRFPNRTFDVGIAEQHAVTFAAGLAAAGYRPICHLYSTFAQRAYDQIIHDVALQNLPVVFVLDRAGLVGEDGATHHGAFDLAFLRAIPNITLAAPAWPDELPALLNRALAANGPFVIRFPRSAPQNPTGQLPAFTEGGSRWLREGGQNAILALGTPAASAWASLQPGVALGQCQFVEPLDEAFLHEAFKTYQQITTLEAGSRGGFGSAVAEFAAKHGYTNPLHLEHLPHAFIPHGPTL